MSVERTLSIIKPDAVERNLIGKIVARFEEEGLEHRSDAQGPSLLAEAQGFYAVTPSALLWRTHGIHELGAICGDGS